MAHAVSLAGESLGSKYRGNVTTGLPSRELCAVHHEQRLLGGLGLLSRRHL